MTKDNWYTNDDWDAETETRFRAKLARARASRPQYLNIQAFHLIAHHPLVALKLIDEYFETKDAFFLSSAWATRAKALANLGRIDEAVEAYKRALDWEKSQPGMITTARYDLPQLICERRLAAEYDYAMEILTTRIDLSDHKFPSQRYIWNGCCALLASETGSAADARAFAARALRAAAETHGPFGRHAAFGIVLNTDDDFGRRIKRLARRSGIASLIRFFAR